MSKRIYKLTTRSLEMIVYKKQLLILVLLQIIIAPAVFSFGKIEESKFTYPVQMHYISPANQDGIQDVVKINFSGNIIPATKRKLTELQFSVYDEKGVVVLSDKAEFGDATSYSFDGKNDKGDYLPDGYYVYTMGVVDDKGNASVSQPYPIIIDNTPPDILSVNLNSGNIVSFETGSVATFSVLGSKEVLWRYVAVGDGSERIIFEQSKTVPEYPPQDWDWLGMDTLDKLFKDGSYQVRVEAMDQAGNHNEFVFDMPLIVSQKGSVQIKEIDGLAFSPNGDALKDVLPLQVIFPQNVNNFDVESFTDWTYILQNQEGEEIFSLPLVINERLDFSGRDTRDTVVSDGEYKLYIQFINEAIVYQTNMLDIIVDTQAPQAAVVMKTLPVGVIDGDPFYFGGTDRTSISGYFRALEDLEWSISISKEVDGVFQLFSDVSVNLDNEKKYHFAIDRDSMINENSVTDGAYRLNFYAEDMAGNIGGVSNVSFIRDTAQKKLSVKTDKSAFSAVVSPVHFSINYSQEGVKDFSLSIADSNGKQVKSTTIKRRGIYNFAWDGYSDSQSQVGDGEYIYSVTINYYNGSSVEEKGTLQVDSLAPRLTKFEFSSELINPKDITAPNNILQIRQATNDIEAQWIAEIRNIFEQTVYFEDMNDSLVELEWDGRDQKGKIVPDGDYYYLLTGKDLAGNIVEKDIAFIVDTGSYDTGQILKPEGTMPLVFFPAYSEDIFSYGEDTLLYENLLNIRSVARLLKAYPKLTIKIVGHAAALLSGKEGKIEQSEVLIPLSRGRAKQIQRAIRILGIDETRISTTALGGSVPLIENASSQNIWKNRRVEFVVSQ